jgi:hypothetical protein
MKNKKRIWYMCLSGAALLSILCFTPLVIPHGNSGPVVNGVPRTFWLGMLMYFGIVILTFIGTRFYPENEEGRGE